MPKGCIIYCIETGLLEKNSLLSIASIRQFGGKLNDYDIFCIQPRAYFNISKKTKSLLSEFGATFIKVPLNIRHNYYALANKPLVCDYIMKNYAYDHYIFLDSDTLVLNVPTELLSFSGEIGLCPVAHQGIGIPANISTVDKYWKQLLDHLKIDESNLPIVETSRSKESIIAYWNSGVISFGGRSSICEEWKNLLNYVLDHRALPESGIFFVEQTCLSAVLLQSKYQVQQMSVSLNFPMTRKSIQQDEVINLNEICVLHHYNNLRIIKDRQYEILGEDRAEWIDQQLDRFGIYPQSLFQKWGLNITMLQIALKQKLFYLANRLSSN